MYTSLEKSLLSDCRLCPRECGVNRIDGELGYCQSDAGFSISSICVHKGEEPVISGEKGICNVFFTHCNLQCVYCQNHEISDNQGCFNPSIQTLPDIIQRICSVLDQTENIVGFVSPSHFVPQMTALIRGLRKAGRNPIFVYNSNGYDKAETLRFLEGIIDIYLPDFKYADPILAQRYSGALDYPEVVLSALKEMYRQKGAGLRLADHGLAESGLIVRHLVLPDATQNSLEVLRTISEELSVKCHISLMAQYYPTPQMTDHPVLNRSITQEEYHLVVDAFHSMGFYRGWVQEPDSSEHYRPDFSRESPFETT